MATLTLLLHALPSLVPPRAAVRMRADAAASPRCGLMCVGLAGNNGVTLLAAQIANRRSIAWEGPKGGRREPDYVGAITQVGPLARRHSALARFDDAAVGGWDVRDIPLGTALYESRILDYDLVRQIRSEMDEIQVMDGVFDAGFVGTSVVDAASPAARDAVATRAEDLGRLRSDIRRFTEDNNVDGHCTVIWSASVERPSEEFASAADLLDAIANDDREVSPSLLYATAAVLEGCSFVNSGSQNTVQPGLIELASQAPSPVYVLGTDFKAGQTKAKTAIVEYLRAIGLRPRTIASYNHLGNNDMKNLLSPSTWKAKARVKTDIFAPWAEEGSEIDHQVAVLYTEQMGDEKRDTVEYTSDAFMGCEHTLLTYTRCMDSALCVPLMIDCAVLCDYCAARRASFGDVAKGLAYLFKLNEGAGAGVDPGFFNQSYTLAAMLDALPAHAMPATDAADNTGAADGSSEGFVGGAICVGLSCVDQQLLDAAVPPSREDVVTFNGVRLGAGGAVPNTAIALSELGVPSVAALTQAGDDSFADELTSQLHAAGVDTTMLMRAQGVATSLAVLPLYAGGGRGCWVDLRANDLLTPASALGALSAESAEPLRAGAAAVHVGYPHLLRGVQGPALLELITGARDLLRSRPISGDLGRSPIVSIDVNGATGMASAAAMDVLAPALSCVDLLHANLDEAMHLVGLAEADAVCAHAAALGELRGESAEGTAGAHVDAIVDSLAAPLHDRGVAIVAVTLGAAGAIVSVTADAARIGEGSASELGRAAATWTGQAVWRPALRVAGSVDATGAGDAFVAGMIAALLWRSPLSLAEAVGVGLASARRRVDSEAEPAPMRDALRSTSSGAVSRTGS